MFFRKKTAASAENDRVRVREMASALLSASGVEFDRSDQLRQALIGTFLFGMAHAHAINAKLSAEQARDLMMTAYQDVLHYAPQAATKAIQHCVDATKPGVHDTMHAIMHRGIDGYRQYVEGDLSGLTENIRSILERFGQGGG